MVKDVPNLSRRFTYVGMVDEENKVLHKQRFRNELPLILAGLDPFKKDVQGVVVESTFNWYWLVDGLMDQGYRVHLANVSAIKQYEGLKQIDDQRSAFWLANLLRRNLGSRYREGCHEPHNHGRKRG